MVAGLWLWASGYGLFGTLALLLLLADLLAFAAGRRMLNPRRLTDRRYRRLRRRLVRERVLDKDAAYEPRAVGTLAGHWRSIEGWSLTMSAAVGALLTVAAIAAAFLIPVPAHVAADTDAVSLHLAVGFWLALGLQGYSLLIGNAIGYAIAIRRVATLPPDDAALAPAAVERASSRRRRWIPRFLYCVVIAADIVITLLFAQAASTQTGSGAADFTWLVPLLLVVPPLMVLSLVLGEFSAFRVSRRRPLRVSPDVALARHAYTRLREQSVWTYRGFAATSIGMLAYIQYGLIWTIILAQLQVPQHGDYSFALAYGFPYIFLALVCLLAGGVARSVGTYRQAQPAVPSVTSVPRRPAGHAPR
jgi:hypothetical protein